MRLGNLSGRLTLIIDGKALDVATASDGLFGPEVQPVYARWDEFVRWAKAADGARGVDFAPELLGPPVPRPPQVFGIGVNYKDHAAEMKRPLPERPLVFTKFPSSVTGPHSVIALPKGSVDFETELVVVMGREARRVSEATAWDFVAGLTIGQDLSERELQNAGANPQFSLGKSFEGFAPLGPVLVTPDEFADRDDLELGCTVAGETMQRSRTSQMVFTVATLIAYLSNVLTLWPGDVIFTGTPAGVGWGRNPKRLLRPDDELVTFIEGIGEMRHRFTAAS